MSCLLTGVIDCISQVGALVDGPLVDIVRKYLPGDDILPDGRVPEENVHYFSWTSYMATLLAGLVV